MSTKLEEIKKHAEAVLNKLEAMPSVKNILEGRLAERGSNLRKSAEYLDDQISSLESLPDKLMDRAAIRQARLDERRKRRDDYISELKSKMEDISDYPDSYEYLNLQYKLLNAESKQLALDRRQSRLDAFKSKIPEKIAKKAAKVSQKIRGISARESRLNSAISNLESRIDSKTNSLEKKHSKLKKEVKDRTKNYSKSHALETLYSAAIPPILEAYSLFIKTPPAGFPNTSEWYNLVRYIHDSKWDPYEFFMWVFTEYGNRKIYSVLKDPEIICDPDVHKLFSEHKLKGFEPPQQTQ